MKYITVDGKNVALKSVHKIIFYDLDQLIDVKFKEAPTETYTWNQMEDLVDKRKRLENLNLVKHLMKKH